MKFYTKEDYNWVADANGYKFCRVNTVDGPLDLQFHKGVTKILSKGEPTLKEKLIAEFGEQEGAKKAEAIYARGTKRHAKIENNLDVLPESLLKGLGNIIGQEVLVWNSNLKNKKVIGFIDAISQDADGNYHLIDFKTKSNPFIFNKFDPIGALQKAYLQLVAYAILCKQLYNIEIQSCKVAIIFLDDSEPELFTLERSAFMSYAQQFLQKLLA